jgi:hypothetical protein
MAWLSIGSFKMYGIAINKDQLQISEVLRLQTVNLRYRSQGRMEHSLLENSGNTRKSN